MWRLGPVQVHCTYARCPARLSPQQHPLFFSLFTTSYLLQGISRNWIKRVQSARENCHVEPGVLASLMRASISATVQRDFSMLPGYQPQITFLVDTIGAYPRAPFETPPPVSCMPFGCEVSSLRLVKAFTVVFEAQAFNYRAANSFTR